MARRTVARSGKPGVLFLAIFAFVVAPVVPHAYAGNFNVNGRFNRSVGGISIDAQGVLSNTETADMRVFIESRQKAMQAIPSDMQQFSKMRKISLRGLEDAIAKYRSQPNGDLPSVMRNLAGLQRIEYVFVFPEQKDIVIAGPAEGWKLSDTGDKIGVTTNLPVLRLDDLLVALRSAKQSRRTGISCSIDPTNEGVKRLQSLTKRLGAINGPGDLRASLTQIEKALGPQVISIEGVPESSHFARMLVAADFRMKRIAMNFERAPVAGLPSFLATMKSSRATSSNMLPRWWLAPKADALLKSSDGLSWKFRNIDVQCMTEQDFVNKDGSRTRSGKADVVAQKWADLFTEKYDELAKADPTFGQLPGLIDLAVFSALINNENLFSQVNLQAPYLLREEPLDVFFVPKQVDSRTSFLKKGRSWLISASGGVQLFPSDIAAKTEKSDDFVASRPEGEKVAKNWWWD